MKNSSFRRSFARLAGSACTVLFMGVAFVACSDEMELLTGQPSWLGESIYDELQKRGNFNETLKLIQAQDEDYVSMLSKTGSVTLFAADDEAWQRFYASNPWGVKSIEELSAAQKKLLFKGNMLNSAYLIDMLGNAPLAAAGSEVQEGNCMRRASRVTLMDSLITVTREEYPAWNPVRVDTETGEVIDYWARLRKDRKALFASYENPVMIHLMPSFMRENGFTDRDVDFLTNHEIHTIEDGSINGVTIKEADVTCQNGYLHIVQDVPMQLDNMAALIGSNPSFSIYNRLLNRFSYPYDDSGVLGKYKEQVDSTFTGRIYVRRFFTDYGRKEYQLTSTQSDDKALPSQQVTTLLPFDPAWNGYALYSANEAPADKFRNDAAVMLVPTDAAMLDYLEHEGRDLKLRYEHAGDGETAWDNAPDDVVLPLIKNTMLPSLKAAIPTQFGSITNSASELMGVKEEDIARVLWANNGVVYQTNKVYVAPEYVSVFYPCVLRSGEDLKLVYKTVMDDKAPTAGGKAEGFYAYLNNMSKDADNPHAGYSFIIPTDQALQTYYDPVTFNRMLLGRRSSMAYKFRLNNRQHIAADAYEVDWEDLDENFRGKITDKKSTALDYPTSSTTGESDKNAYNHFKDIMNSSLATTLFHYPQRVYSAKNGGPIVVDWQQNGTEYVVNGVAGSFQYERGYYVPVEQIVDKSRDGNGTCYIVEKEPLMSTFQSPYAAITAEERADQFGVFAQLLQSAGSGKQGILKEDDGAGHSTMDRAISYLSNYHYTIYVPESSSIQSLLDSHKLVLADVADDIEERLKNRSSQKKLDSPNYISQEDSLYLTRQAVRIRQVLRDFVTYHIQDNSVYFYGDNHNGDAYESSCLDTLTNRFCKLWITYLPDANGNGSMTVRDVKGNVRTVNKDYSNIMTRQYYFDGKTLNASTDIHTSSFAVIHMIDGPLETSADCYCDPADYDKVMTLLEKYPPVEKEEED